MPDQNDPQLAESHYQALGRRKGPLADAKVQAAARDYWSSAGQAGATWLVQRLRTETNVEALHAVGSQLADLGQVALRPILDELDREPTVDQAIALLKAVGWMVEADPALHCSDPATEATLGRLLQSREADIREAAAEAFPLVPPNRSVVWLESRLHDEQVEDVLLTIRAVLDHLRIGV